jgi:Ca-activated chloride channel family protein
MPEFGFEYPWLLLFTPLAPLLAWWLCRRRRPALRYSDTAVLDGLPGGGAMLAWWGAAALRGLAVLLTVLAAANPRVPDLRTPLPVEGIAIVLVLDVSGSMNTPDFDPDATPPVTRLDAAKAAVRQFVSGGDTGGVRFDGRPNDQIGLVTFAAVADTACPLTLNHPVLLTVLDEQRAKSGIDAGTNVGDALGEGLVRMNQLDKANDKRRRVLVLLSDGEHNVVGEDKLRPLQAAQLAAKLGGIPIYTIDCGGDGSAGDAEERKQRADGRAVLEQVADLTGGKAFVATDAAEMKEVFAQIDQLEKAPAVKFVYRRYRPFGPWCAVAAAAVVLWIGLLERTRWSRLP